MTLEQRKILGEARAQVTYLIKHELNIRGYKCQDAAQKIGVVPSAFSRVLHGGGHSKQILDGLREIGVPEELLFDPRRVPHKGSPHA